MSTLGTSDQDLLGGIRTGDRSALELLFRTYYPGLLRFARAQLRDPTEAEDVVHDVFLRIWSHRAEVGGDRSVRNYLLRAVRNRVIDVVRHRKVEHRWIQSNSVERTDAGDAMAVYQVATPESGSDAAALAELDAAIRRAVADLPERCRTVFLLCREQELSYAEAAEVIGVTPATVKTHMARALAALRRELDPYLTILIAISSLAY